MTPQEMINKLDIVWEQLTKADDLSPTQSTCFESIGALIIAIDHLREVVKELVEKEVEA